MGWLSNLKIGARLAMGFSIVIFLLLLVAAIGINRVTEAVANTDFILQDRYVKVAHGHVIENAVYQQGGALRTALIATDLTEVKAELAKVSEADVHVAAAIEALKALIREGKGQAELQALVDAGAKYRDRQAKLVELALAQSLDEGGIFLMKDLLPVQKIYLQALDTFTRGQVDAMKLSGEAASAAATIAKTVMAVLALLATVIAAAVAILLTRSITRPIAQAVKVAETVASGDLSMHISVNSKDEVGQLLAALQIMSGGLVDLVRRVRHGSDAIFTGSSQIAVGNADLSERTERQASNLQQTAASMEEISATVRNSADAARRATTMARAASDVATKGGAVVREVVNTMNEIAASSKRVTEITGMIDGIAFQTNILALNAAVEAARAGAQGRGFSVVANEVRSLAQRASAAAKQIRELTGESSARVDSGARLVGEAGRTMNEIVLHVGHVSQLISEIDAASHEQTAGMGQIGDAVSDLDQVTQQNASLVEEAAAAAEHLQAQAKELTDAVGAFRLEASA